MAKIFKDGKFLKYYKESWFNPEGMTDDGYYIHVPSEDICDEYPIVKQHGRLKAFHPDSKWARHPGEIEPSGLFVTKNFSGRWYFVDTEITDKERENKENWMLDNDRLREEAKLRKEENIKTWKAKTSARTATRARQVTWPKPGRQRTAHRARKASIAPPTRAHFANFAQEDGTATLRASEPRIRAKCATPEKSPSRLRSDLAQRNANYVR